MTLTRCTTPPPVENPSTWETPERVRTCEKVLQGICPSSPFTPEKRARCEEMEHHIRKAPDTPKRRKRSQLARRAIRGIVSATQRESKITTGGFPPVSPSDHVNGFQALKQSPWALSTCASLQSLDEECDHKETSHSPKFHNIDHATSPTQKGTGWHFCPELYTKLSRRRFIFDITFDSYKVSIRKDQVTLNPYSGICVVKWQKDATQPYKYPSLFPPSIRTEEELVTFIQEAEEVARNNSRVLSKNRDRLGKEIHFEYFLNHRLMVPSCFPVFFFQRYQKDTMYCITKDIILDSSVILRYVKEAAANVHRRTYENDNDMIVDITEKIPGLKDMVRRGVLIQISKKE